MCLIKINFFILGAFFGKIPIVGTGLSSKRKEHGDLNKFERMKRQAGARADAHNLEIQVWVRSMNLNILLKWSSACRLPNSLESLELNSSPTNFIWSMLLLSQLYVSRPKSVSSMLLTSDVEFIVYGESRRTIASMVR